MTSFILILLYTLSALFLTWKVYKSVRKDGISPPFKDCCIHAAVILLPTNMFIAALVMGWDAEDWFKKRKKFN